MPRSYAKSPIVNARSLGRRERRVNAFGLLAVFLFLASPVLAIVAFGPRASMAAFFLPGLGLLLAYGVASRWAYTRDAREIIAADYRCCTRCRYPLPAPSEGICSECGRPYQAATSVGHWRHYYASAVPTRRAGSGTR